MKVFIIFLFLFSSFVMATEPVKQAGYIENSRLSTESVTKGNVTTTTGYIGTKPIRLKTTTTKTGSTTTGWVDNQYVRIKADTPKDQKD